MTDLIRAECAHAINGVRGRLHNLYRPPAPWISGVFANQTWVSESRAVSGYGSDGRMTVNIRFDDNCKNGHMSFAITAEVVTAERRRRSDIAAGGCMHDEISVVFPELAPLIKWHLVSTDGPMHYIANTLFHASDADHWGRRKGEPVRFDHAIYFGSSPVSHKLSKKLTEFIRARMVPDMDGGLYRKENTGEFRVVSIAHERDPKTYGTHYTFVGFGDKWHECPFLDEQTAQEWASALNSLRCEIVANPVEFSEGKERQLDAARSVAVWPEATDEQLCAPKEELRAALEARLPALLAAFRADMERIGFLWACPSDML